MVHFLNLDLFHKLPDNLEGDYLHYKKHERNVMVIKI